MTDPQAAIDPPTEFVLSGRVVDQVGQPASGLRVDPFERRITTRVRLARSVATDETGGFRIRCRTAHPVVRLVVRRGRAVVGESAVVLYVAADTTIEVTLHGFRAAVAPAATAQAGEGPRPARSALEVVRVQVNPFVDDVPGGADGLVDADDTGLALLSTKAGVAKDDLVMMQAAQAGARGRGCRQTCCTPSAAKERPWTSTVFWGWVRRSDTGWSRRRSRRATSPTRCEARRPPRSTRSPSSR